MQHCQRIINNCSSVMEEEMSPPMGLSPLPIHCATKVSARWALEKRISNHLSTFFLAPQNKN
jgi:hypothetical protein